jgi:hypothetical protein
MPWPGGFRRNHFAAPHSLQSFSVAFPSQRAIVTSTTGRAEQLKTKRPPKGGLSGLRDCYAFEDCAAAIAINVTTATTPKASNIAILHVSARDYVTPAGQQFCDDKAFSSWK